MGVVATYEAALKTADRRLAAGRRRAAAAAFGEAIHLAFDRSLHFDSVGSPLAADPEQFVSPLRDSLTAQALRAPRGRASPGFLPGCPPRAGETTRVLVATDQNVNFLSEILDRLEENPQLEHRVINLDDEGDLLRGLRKPAGMADEILTGRRGSADRAERVLRPLLDWADVLFVEWCRPTAVLLTMVDPRDTRVMVRLHSYEAFTAWPHLMDFSRVDDLLFVSDHLRDLAVAAIPALREPEAPRLHTVPLGLRLAGYALPKPDAARFTLALVGWGSVAKDPLWALELVRRLRRHDDRFRLQLIGDEFAGDVSPSAREYADRLARELAALEGVGAVQRTGRTADVAGALTEVGVIVSSSVRESFHAGLVEGAASGAVPVVRDWPFFAGKTHGAGSLFPGDWVVADLAQAVERVLAHTATDAVWRSSGSLASGHALRTWDWDVVKHGYDQLLTGRGLPG